MKRARGQFYTTRSAYILDGVAVPPGPIVEPFAGQGDLIDWMRAEGYQGEVRAYDIDPKRPDIERRDTLAHPPTYRDAYVLTNPPYLARNKSSDKTMFDRYETSDLYKCFILSMIEGQCLGGVMLIPAGFFFSPRVMDARCRAAFMRRYRVTSVKYFEESVFEDTTTTIVVVSFQRSDQDLLQQDVEWFIEPSHQRKTFRVCDAYNWIIGGEVYHLPVRAELTVRRYCGEKRADEQCTNLTLHAIDGVGAAQIALDYKPGHTAIEATRTFATLCVGGAVLSEEQQQELCRRFNAFMKQKREETHSLFLPQFREYARKRIPFELAYLIVRYLLAPIVRHA
jgi:hypothetical protein